jgi:hypothetical protein
VLGFSVDGIAKAILAQVMPVRQTRTCKCKTPHLPDGRRGVGGETAFCYLAFCCFPWAAST